MADDAIIFDDAVLAIGTGVIDLDSDSFKAVLTNVAPNKATDSVLADITQIASGNGYTTGGVALAGAALTESAPGSGIWVWTVDDFSWTASGGSIDTFRYVVIYDDTAPSDRLVCYEDLGAAQVIPQTTIFTMLTTSGVLRFGPGVLS